MIEKCLDHLTILVSLCRLLVIFDFEKQTTTKKTLVLKSLFLFRKVCSFTLLSKTKSKEKTKPPRKENLVFPACF